MIPGDFRIIRMADLNDSPSTQKPKALVIDDDPAIGAFLKARLGRYLDVVALTDPARAVEVAKRERPDVVLCDINMPGMQGDEVAFALSQDDATVGIPLLYLSSLVPGSDPAELDDRFGGHIAVPKTASADQLLAVIRGVTGAGT